ncbi:hypothetical protein JCM14076_27600 [Methylosoma difficile]
MSLAGLLLCFGLAWLTVQHPFDFDLTHSASNTLSPASQKLLQSLPDKVEVTAYIKKGQSSRQQIALLIDRYNRYKADLTLSFVDPDAEPDKTRELDIGAEGLVTVAYQGRVEKISFIDESTLTNALLQLANAKLRWVTFLSGHGERSPEGIANFDLSFFNKELNRRNIKALSINLANMPAIPDNSSLLVIAAPSVPLLAGEIAVVKNYIEKGGNLLLLTDPDNTAMAEVEALVGIKQYRGTLLDKSFAIYGVGDPSFIVASEYLEHAITKNFKTITIYPKTAALSFDSQSGFTGKALFNSTAKSWTETGDIKASPSLTANTADQAGPLPFAYALTREFGAHKQQRILVLGDGDFLANAYLGNIGNLDMGLRMFNWLVHDDQFIDIPAKTANDKNLQLSPTSMAAMAFGFLIVLPLLLFVVGLWIWISRKRR